MRQLSITGLSVSIGAYNAIYSISEHSDSNGYMMFVNNDGIEYEGEIIKKVYVNENDIKSSIGANTELHTFGHILQNIFR